MDSEAPAVSVAEEEGLGVQVVLAEEGLVVQVVLAVVGQVVSVVAGQVVSVAVVAAAAADAGKNVKAARVVGIGLYWTLLLT